MAGNHRAARSSVPARAQARPSRKKAPPKLEPWMLVVAAVVAVIPAIWLGSHRLFGSDDPTAPQEQAPIPSVTSSAKPPSTPTTPTPGATTGAPTALTKVAVDVPRRLHVAGLLDVGFDDSVSPTGGGFKAGSTAEAARWAARGKPGSPGTDTVYLIGKVYTAGSSAFDKLPSVKKGTRVSVRTDNGVLTYTVDSASRVPSAGMLKTPVFQDRVPGRLVLVGILFDAQDDQRTGKYLVVVAHLSGARRT